MPDYKLDDRGSTPDRRRGCLLQPLHPDRRWGPPSLLCTLHTGGPFPKHKVRPGRDADHSAPSSAEVKKE
jgi:hypothetical protein